MNKQKKRRIVDKLTKTIVYLVSSITFLILLLIIAYIVVTGIRLVNFDLFIGSAQDYNMDVYIEGEPSKHEVPDYNGDAPLYYSENWGIGFVNNYDKEGHEIVTIEYISSTSPFQNSFDNNNVDENNNPIPLKITIGATLKNAFLSNGIVFGTMDAGQIRDLFEEATSINHLSVQNTGGGIRGSLIATLYLIVATLILAIPLGIATAVFFNEYAKSSRFTSVIRYLVDLLTGVPSIIYGLLGAAIFIPLVNNLLQTSGGSIISGALTMSVVLLPVIIKSTEEALKVIPNHLRNASLALGASKTQTIFKVVLPSAVPGILTGVLLGVGRIIGESAALIFAIGVTIKDNVVLTERATTLSVHIWSIMGGESPNYELASAIALIILVTVVFLSIIIKYIARKFNKSWY